MGGGLPDRIYINEKTTRTLSECPPEVGKQLQRAAFTEQGPNTYVKTRTPHGSDTSRPVVTATVNDGELTVSASDIVGIVELTPQTKLQIDPNVNWEDILDMFLAVRQQQRSLEYQGIPIDDFLADDIQIQDIFIVITVNYLSALQPLHRNGFIRQFETRQYDAVTGRGRLDVEQSIMNHRQGIPKQRYIEKNIDYNTPVNTLIYAAGKQLVRLFQTTNEASHDQYFQIFSELRESLRWLEAVGIVPDGIDLSELRNVDIGNLPRQRSYYRDALQVSKTILSSATGESLATGEEDLTMDFILDMDSLFEQYTQIVLEEELSFLQNNPLYTAPQHYSIEDKPTLPVFENAQGHYKPDHVLWDKKADDAVAVLDSKYYAQEHTPISDSDARTRMLAYAHLLETDTMAYLTPFGPTARRRLALRDGSLQVVCPVNGDFSTDAYRDAVREFLKQVLDVTAVGDNMPDLQSIAHSEVTIETLDDLASADPLVIPDERVSLYLRNIANGAIDCSNQVYRQKTENVFECHGPLKEYVREDIDQEETDMLLPLFVAPDTDHQVPAEDDENGYWDGEALAVYPITTERGDVADIGEPEYIRLNWG